MSPANPAKKAAAFRIAEKNARLEASLFARSSRARFPAGDERSSASDATSKALMSVTVFVVAGMCGGDVSAGS
jgi:hypothetical protein